jgi:diamine N-acetyltransferase
MPSLPRLEKVTRTNVIDACRLRIRPEQKGFVAPVSWSLAQAYVFPPEKVWPRLVYDGDPKRAAGATSAS